MLQLFRPRSATVRLTGPRVYIRPPQIGDQRAWLALRRDSRSFLEPYEPAWPHDALTPVAFRRRLRRMQSEWQSESSYGFFIFDRDTDELLGGITIANVRRGVIQSATVGYWIGEPHKRRGYMFESLLLCLDFAFKSLDLHRVEAACLLDNEPSRGLLQKCGFRYEGQAREYLCIAGKWQDHETFAILRTDARPIIAIQS